jgi:hypothetical protein
MARAQARILATLQVQRGVFDGLVHGNILRARPATLAHPRGCPQAAHGMAYFRLAYFRVGIFQKGINDASATLCLLVVDYRQPVLHRGNGR